jgi:general secretion pathway protein J
MNRAKGFTLIEILVAVAVMAVMGIMALVGLNTVIDQQAIATAQADRWSKVQFTLRMLTQDLSQLHPRGIRADSTLLASIDADPNSAYPLEFSRGGWNNPAGLPRGTIQRVAYEIEDDKLFRLHWSVLDRTLSAIPIRNELVDGVEEIELRFLDDSGQWQPSWPPLGVPPDAALSMRPRAVEVKIHLEDMGEIWRLVEVSG